MLAVLDTLEEMLALRFERFFLFNIRSIHIPVMIGVLELGKRVVMWGPFDAGIENANFLEWRDVIIDDHPLAADDGHFADFAGIEPTAVNHSGAVFGEAEAHGRDILHARGDMSAAATVNAQGLLLHNVENDRDIVRGQIPGHVDVLLEQAQIQAPR